MTTAADVPQLLCSIVRRTKATATTKADYLWAIGKLKSRRDVAASIVEGKRGKVCLWPNRNADCYYLDYLDLPDVCLCATVNSKLRATHTVALQWPKLVVVAVVSHHSHRERQQSHIHAQAIGGCGAYSRLHRYWRRSDVRGYAEFAIGGEAAAVLQPHPHS